MIALKNRVLWNLPGAVLALGCILLCGENASARDVALVTSKSNRVREMKAADLTRMIKTTHKWLDGNDLTVVLTDPSSPQMRIVAERLLSLTPNEFRQMIYVANKTKVRFLVVSTDDEALKTLQSDPYAIGLVSVYSINSNVDVLKINGKLPLEPGYLLHSQ
jgi:hypothetical protein